MWSFLSRIASACWGPVRRMSKDDENDPLLWSRDVSPHAAGDFSMAAVQANQIVEDYCQVEVGREGVFVGVYDGHGGIDAAKFVSDHLFKHFCRLAREKGTISEEVVANAFSATEDGFLNLVKRAHEIKPSIAAVGSCCLVGVLWRGTLYIANLGDSRVVIGSLGRSNKIMAEQLTRDHNASMEEVRAELRSRHPDDSHIVVLKNGVWRIKGIIQVSRSIGDAYLKRPEFSIDPSTSRFRLSEPLRRPVLTAEPSVFTRVIRPQDKFLIYASDGLWEHLTNQEAVEIVHKYPQRGIARRLIRRALHEVARKREMRYADLRKLGKGTRRYFHDDISVVVVFIDHELPLGPNLNVPELSVRGFTDAAGPSNFPVLDGSSTNASSF